jgi:hypothetical protein
MRGKILCLFSPIDLFLPSPPSCHLVAPLVGSFDILVRASKNVELISEWYRHLEYNPRKLEPQLVEFLFQVKKPGKRIGVRCRERNS